MTTTAFDDQYLTAPEPVREPMSREAILRRNVAALEVALKQQTERAEAAEAELAKLREQEPVCWFAFADDGGILLELWGHDEKACKYAVLMNAKAIGWKGTLTGYLMQTGWVIKPLYAVPVPAPHKGATHCDDCGLTWLDDGLNPLGCPYCKAPVPAPAAKCRGCNGHGVLGNGNPDSCDVECHFCRGTGIDHAPMPAVPAEWMEKLVSAFPLFDDEGLCQEKHHCEWVLHQDRKRLHALLQSAEVRHD